MQTHVNPLLMFSGFTQRGTEVYSQIRETLLKQGWSESDLHVLSAHPNDGDADNGGYTWEAFAQDLPANWLERAERLFLEFHSSVNRPVDLLVYSIGAPIAMWLHLRHPEKVGNLVLLNPAFKMNLPFTFLLPLFYFFFYLPLSLFGFGRWASLLKVRVHTVSGECNGEVCRDGFASVPIALAARLMWLQKRVGMSWLQKYYRDRTWWTDASSTRVLIIHGSLDRVIPVRVSRNAAAWFPPGTVTGFIAEPAGHDIIGRPWKHMAPAVIAFLRDGCDERGSYSGA